MTIKTMTEIPPHVAYRRCKCQKILDEFLAAGCSCAECIFTPEEYSTPKSLQGALYQAAKRLHYPVRIVISKGHVYLMRMSPDEYDQSAHISKGGELKVD